MPVTIIEASAMAKEQKGRLVKELVAKAGEILEIPEPAFITLIRENEPDNAGNNKSQKNPVRSISSGPGSFQ